MAARTTEGIFHDLREGFAGILYEHNLGDTPVNVSARPLTPGEAIGNPEADDYPILKGKERMMEATFLTGKGQAFTDMCGEWSGRIGDVPRMDLKNNFRRAIFVSSLNATMRHLGLIEGTIHCRDDGPVRCGEECVRMLRQECPHARVTIIGFQPRILENVSNHFTVNIVDMDEENIGKEVCGTTVSGPERTSQYIDDCDVVLVTGTSLVNGTITRFMNGRASTIFYGVTIAGAARILGLQRYCPFAF